MFGSNTGNVQTHKVYATDYSGPRPNTVQSLRIQLKLTILTCQRNRGTKASATYLHTRYITCNVLYIVSLSLSCSIYRMNRGDETSARYLHINSRGNRSHHEVHPNQGFHSVVKVYKL